MEISANAIQAANMGSPSRVTPISLVSHYKMRRDCGKRQVSAGCQV